MASERATSASGLDSLNSAGDAATSAVPFHGEHQAGIVTPAQDWMHFAALDVITPKRAELVELLRAWTRAAERMTAGEQAVADGAVGGSRYAPPEDTGEALDLPGQRTDPDRRPRRIVVRRPLRVGAVQAGGTGHLPHFPLDDLDPSRSGGDLCIQACANDPQAAVHAVRNLVRIGFGAVAVRWSQLGFGRTSSTSRTQFTPRNLFGFKDGTNNLKAEDVEALREHVWVQTGDGLDWMAGGTYLVARRIRMHIETWDRTPLAEHEAIVGRRKGTGAPLGQLDEFDQPDLHVRGTGGEPMIPVDAHIRLASKESLGGVRILRRGYNFVDGSDGQGHLDAGLFFVCFARDAHRQFVPMLQALSTSDRMMEYVEHTGSALFAVPPGVRPGGFWGDTLLG